MGPDGRDRASTTSASHHAGRRRSVEVDTLRGIACLLLVGFHVVSSAQARGAVSWEGYQHVISSLTYLRMPLFAFLAGIVYAWRPVGAATPLGTFAAKKVRRLLVPYVLFVPLLGVMKELAGGGRDFPVLDWLLFTIQPYWFLLAMCWVFALVVLLDRRGLLAREPVAVAAVAVAAVADALVPGFGAEEQRFLLGLRPALLLLPFFLLGLSVTRFAWNGWGRRPRLVVAVLLVGLVAWTQAGFAGWVPATPTRGALLGIALGMAACLALSLLALRVGWLAWVGDYSSGIYLLHVFPVTAVVLAGSAAGVGGPPLLVVALVAGILLSILGVRILRTMPPGRVLLGESAGRRRRTPDPV